MEIHVLTDDPAAARFHRERFLERGYQGEKGGVPMRRRTDRTHLADLSGPAWWDKMIAVNPLALSRDGHPRFDSTT